MTQSDDVKVSVISKQGSIHQTLIKTQRRQNRFDGLDQIKILGYGVGHFINDLSAACWVVKTQAAPSALLAGQIADGIATPIVGYFSDRTKTKYGQRTPWYVLGLVLVVGCFIPIFQTFNSDNVAHQYAYYTIFPALFNLGWASLQISHMSLVPSLTCSRRRRDRLNNLRNTFTFISNFLVLGMGVLIFKFMSNPSLEYSIISYIVVALGLTASCFFLYQVKEVPLSQISHEKATILKKQLQQQKKIVIGSASAAQFSEDDDSNQGVHLSSRQRLVKSQSIKDWFKMPKFYLFGICYMGVRLYTNMFGTFLPFYLIGVLRLGIDQATETQVPFTVALVPLIVYLFSVISSSRLNWFYTKFGRKAALSVGTIICVVSLGSMLFLTESTGWVMYIIAIFVGISQTMVLSTGINFISDVVGTKAKTGAFVFGIYSLLDKFSAGFVIFFIGSTQAYSRQDLKQLTQSQKQFIRYTMVLIPAMASVLATLIVISYPIKQYAQKGKQRNSKSTNRKNSIQEELVL